ncbi:LPXTG cell wall anchor domain-containing protein [Streptomyces sp. NPDC002676]
MAALLVTAPLVNAGSAHARDHTLYGGPHPTKTAYPPYPPKPPRPHHPHDEEHGHHEKPEHGHHGQPGHERGDERGHERGHLANTGDNGTKQLIMGGIAASLVAAGAGTMLVARRRRSS